MTLDELEQTHKFFLDYGRIFEHAALVMLCESQRRGLSTKIGQAAVSHAAMLIAAQYFNGDYRQFIDAATGAISCHELDRLHVEGTETRQ